MRQDLCSVISGELRVFSCQQAWCIQRPRIMPHSTMESASLNPLYRADGSATYTSNGYAILAAVNGPMEVQRRDELPEEAAIDVAIRPASGVGGGLVGMHW